jgi:hypothetical protein
MTGNVIEFLTGRKPADIEVGTGGGSRWPESCSSTNLRLDDVPSSTSGYRRRF